MLQLEGKTSEINSNSLSANDNLLRHGCEGLTPNAVFDGRSSNFCISDIECDGKEDFSIFNHFDESGTEMVLVPECRWKNAPDMPGFTCGSDPSLRTGTKIVVRGVPETQYENDNRQVKLLQNHRYNDLSTALNGQSECPNHDDNYCATIDHFNDGCDSFEVVDGYAVFKNPFHQPGCEPNVTEIVSNDSMMEEYKLYLGYDDLTDSIFKSDSHKVYEISCKIAKIGSVNETVIVEQEGGHVDHEDSIETNFYIEKYFGDESPTLEDGDLMMIIFHLLKLT